MPELDSQIGKVNPVDSASGESRWMKKKDRYNITFIPGNTEGEWSVHSNYRGSHVRIDVAREGNQLRGMVQGKGGFQAITMGEFSSVSEYASQTQGGEVILDKAPRQGVIGRIQNALAPVLSHIESALPRITRPAGSGMK